jgi:hypothetical protein
MEGSYEVNSTYWIYVNQPSVLSLHKISNTHRKKLKSLEIISTPTSTSVAGLKYATNKKKREMEKLLRYLRMVFK